MNVYYKSGQLDKGGEGSWSGTLLSYTLPADGTLYTYGSVYRVGATLSISVTLDGASIGSVNGRKCSKGQVLNISGSYNSGSWEYEGDFIWNATYIY